MRFWEKLAWRASWLALKCFQLTAIKLRMSLRQWAETTRVPGTLFCDVA